ncbi:MAG TPA: BMP family ABC transporter substrate-binding protein [Acidimicrobiia bacterium]|jgi:basic membrane protein A
MTWPAAVAALALITAACTSATTTTAAPGTTAAPTTMAPSTTAAPGTTAAASTTAPPFTGTPVKACFVTDLQGVDDRSFNAAGWLGVTVAAEAGYAENDPGPPTNPLLEESSVREDYLPNITLCLESGVQHIVTNGFELGPTTETVSQENLDRKFTIVDYAFADPDTFAPLDYDNVRELVYQTDEAAFAAGYLAAGVSQSGIVGTYGGLNIPTVSIFMDGFARGVAHYNEIKGTSVTVLGWDTEAKEGNFTGSFDPTNPAVVTSCQNLLDEGADIILPVGGIINLPCGTEIQTRGIEAALIGVDVDAFVAMPAEFADLWLTTITKALTEQVALSIQQDATGEWSPGNYVGNLENRGVGLSGYHSWSDRVSPELDAEVQQVLADVTSGAITWTKYDVG